MTLEGLNDDFRDVVVQFADTGGRLQNVESRGPGPSEFEALMVRVESEHRRLAGLLPDMDPGDLHSILVAMLRPWGMGRHFLLRRVRPGVNVF